MVRWNAADSKRQSIAPANDESEEGTNPPAGETQNINYG